MTLRYNYNCTHCGANYLEQRRAEEPQFFVTCQACYIGVYKETSSEVIEETSSEVIEKTIEIIIAPIVEESPAE